MLNGSILIAQASDAMRVTRYIVEALTRESVSASVTFSAMLPLLSICAVDGLEMDEAQFIEACRSVYRKAVGASIRGAVVHA